MVAVRRKTSYLQHPLLILLEAMMELITKDNIVFALAILTAIPLFKNGILSVAAWNRRWSITLTEREIAFT